MKSSGDTLFPENRKTGPQQYKPGQEEHYCRRSSAGKLRTEKADWARTDKIKQPGESERVGRFPVDVGCSLTPNQ